MVQLLGYRISQLTKPFSFPDHTRGRSGRDWKKRPSHGYLLAIGAELFGDFIIRIVEEHLDIRLAVSRGSSGKPALRDPERELVANFASACDFVLGQCPNEYGFLGSAWRSHVSCYLTLIDDGLICEHMEQAFEIAAAIGMYLRHEDGDHLFGGIDRESCIEKTTPVIFSRRTQFR
jgi:hypothetical protein